MRDAIESEEKIVWSNGMIDSDSGEAQLKDDRSANNRDLC